ncbi:sentrin-specific protease 5 [Tachysurus fulvidraco]|uniref:sentrin-specific protease 5 n=1 Tax=Tachysurus fulvidraco TaxID=1234273 RepID=UPI000F4DB5E1|nr:sentrin-specific protease 5 [Tachysurus fulvidraco]XP_027025765.1 sentrin-specific protease 5 [Tachysurus fulvidraco]
MRVQVHNSSDQAKPAPAEMSENGRARRKRVPKLCDCCGPNTKPHALGHGPVTKKRGRRKKDVENEVEVTTDNHLSSAFVDLSTPDATDTTTVCDMHQVTLPEADPMLSGENIPPGLHNGTVASPENGPKTNSESNDSDFTPFSDSIECSSDTHSTTHASLDSHCDPKTPLDCMHSSPTSHRDCTETFVGSAESSVTTSDQPTDIDAMEIDHAVYAVYLNTKALRDHRYCKRPHVDTEEEEVNISQPPSADIQQEDIVELLHEYLELFYGKYGSFIPLSEDDILEYLNKHLNADFNDRRKMINKEVLKYKAGLACASMHFFKVTYNKHILALEDLSTLEDQNWVNDQVINMYGELIVDSTNHKVHFFNSFFYKQLVAKGYEGVKRWTKKVDVFSKRLLLIPLHLEIHWSLITVDVSKQSINFYDSQGILFKFAVENILKYILAEAKEKKHAALQKGWKMTVNKGIPQQKNDNDCGVFVLEYCKCLAFKEPLQFTQEDMPKVRKRIYKELCDCKLTDLQKQL